MTVFDVDWRPICLLKQLEIDRHWFDTSKFFITQRRSHATISPELAFIHTKVAKLKSFHTNDCLLSSQEEGLEEEDDEGPPPVEPEVGPPLFTSLSEDARIEGMSAWSARVSSTLSPERAMVVLRSNLWPGAVAYATVGK